MKLIAAVDENWAIGQKNRLLVQIPADQKFFRETTEGQVVVLGRRALANFSNGRPLAGRVNVVLSRNPSFTVKSAVVTHSVEETLQRLREYPNQEVYVIGGGSIYRQFLPYCDTALITKICHVYEADTYFPNLEKDPDWVLRADSEEQTYFDLEYYFLRYERKK